MPFDITASIVLFKNDEKILQRAIQSFLDTSLNVLLVLVDNSPSDRLKFLGHQPRVEYIFNNANIGFGKAHNIALQKYRAQSPFHLILNPDVYFDRTILRTIFSYMNENTDVGQLSPLILYPDGSVQYSGKLLPTPVDLIARRLFKGLPCFVRKNKLYELQESGYNTIMNVPNHLGCFMFLRTAVLEYTGLFDENIFMYTEDIDLTRRFHRHSKTIFYPGVTIFHYYGKGSQKQLRLLLWHIRSAIYYFNKWGWFFDAERVRFNKKSIHDYGGENKTGERH